MAQHLPLRWVGNLALLAAAALAVMWFWTPRAERLVSLDSGSAQVLMRQRLCVLHSNANLLVLGNSLAGEGFLANHFNGQAREHFALNLAVPSAHWFLLERMALVAKDAGVRPRVVVLMTAPEHFSERRDFDFLESDLTLAKPVLDRTDFGRLSGHTGSMLRYVDYAPLLLLRPMLYRGELRSLLLTPGMHREQTTRLREVLAAMRTNEPMVENGNPFAVCDAGPLHSVEERLPALRAAGDPRIGDYERLVAGYRARAGVPMAVDPREMARFQRVLALLTGMARRVIVAPAPYWDPDFAQYPAPFRRDMDAAISGVVAATPGASLLPPMATDCTDFMDSVHFNRKGGERFTNHLLQAIEGDAGTDGR